jgi:hypothetical protein
MPSIKDPTTVQAIAREFTSNGRNKTQCMITIGYGKGYSDTGAGQGSVFGNVRVIEAIRAIDDESATKTDITRELLVEKMYAIIEDSTSNKADMTRAASLIADMQGYKREAAPNKEMEQAIAQRMSSEDKELARVTAMIRTNEEARKGLRIA